MSTCSPSIVDVNFGVIISEVMDIGCFGLTATIKCNFFATLLAPNIIVQLFYRMIPTLIRNLDVR